MAKLDKLNKFSDANELFESVRMHYSSDPKLMEDKFGPKIDAILEVMTSYLLDLDTQMEDAAMSHYFPGDSNAT